MKIQLYTCRDGLSLFKRGSLFSAWKDTAKSFEEAETGNFKILVDEKDIKEVREEVDAYDIINIESVEIVSDIS